MSIRTISFYQLIIQLYNAVHNKTMQSKKTVHLLPYPHALTLPLARLGNPDISPPT